MFANMPLFTDGDIQILERHFHEEDFSICQQMFKKYDMMEFLAATNLDPAYERTQFKLKHLITVVNLWSCAKEDIEFYLSRTGVDSYDCSPCHEIWSRYCTFGCQLCYAVKNYSLRYDLRFNKGWRHRDSYFRLHAVLIKDTISFLRMNIANMVEKHCQSRSRAVVSNLKVHYELPVDKNTTAPMDPVNHGETSLKREIEPVRTFTEKELHELFGLKKQPDMDHVITKDGKIRLFPSPTCCHSSELGTGLTTT
jgi:hypothetical protein